MLNSLKSLIFNTNINYREATLAKLSTAPLDLGITPLNTFLTEYFCQNNWICLIKPIISNNVMFLSHLFVTWIPMQSSSNDIDAWTITLTGRAIRTPQIYREL